MLENKLEGAAVVIYDLDDSTQRPVGVRAGSVKARDLIWVDNERAPFSLFTARTTPSSR
ncbi:MAG: hypothetical protein ABL957_05765 [Parvularculaceae bacterium]